MIEITNHTSQTLDFMTGVKDGEPVTKGVKPGATEKVAIAKDNPVVVARINAQAISIKTVAPAKRETTKASRASKPTVPAAGSASDFKPLAD